MTNIMCLKAVQVALCHVLFLFFGAPSPLKRTARRKFKGEHSPVNPVFEVAEPLATIGIFKASGSPEMHTLA